MLSLTCLFEIIGDQNWMYRLRDNSTKRYLESTKPGLNQQDRFKKELASRRADAVRLQAYIRGTGKTSELDPIVKQNLEKAKSKSKQFRNMLKNSK